MSNTSLSMARPARMLLVAFSVAVISGCATYPNGTQQQAQYVLNNDPGKLLNDDNLNSFLSQSPAGSVINLVTSPWGSNVEVVADASYLAASGRECRKLRVVEAGSSARSALVCETPNGWVNQRAVTQTDNLLQGRY
ncbi:DVU3141 family protein [Vreelandella zhanjiangensis]|uniref:DVU3141 family protein n=1 Tax=Vreelandella zhanjiangensis TaxID=1121960 RepID=UPI00036E5D5C|nr:DVU3141 family protein [Halomonas zhanjiangensis]